ncbi:MAG TPA: DinB family protein [Anaerolineales bacterium]|nr:DinB family protein [Anaerolineales bacterium]
MTSLELAKTYTEYHVAMTHRVWDSINKISDEQLLASDSYSRGSVCDLMVHSSSTDQPWLAGLKNQADVGPLKFEHYPTRAAARELFENVAKDLTDYVNAVSEEELAQNAKDMRNLRWKILLHMVNHGTDHRSTVLQKLTELGAPNFDQDFILRLWKKGNSL